jgi:ComF family protein
MLCTRQIEMIKQLLSFIYPQLCFACERELRGDETHVCLHCQEDIPSYNNDQSTTLSDMNSVFQLFWGKSDVLYATSCFEYIKGEKLQLLIHELKYKGQRNLAKYFGEFMVKEITTNNHFSTIDAICFVPSSKRKTRVRGYNQAEELAKTISRMTKIPTVDALVKKKNTSSQTDKNVHERHFNLQNTFALKKTKKSPIKQIKHVLLVDDVITTGATLNACATVLLADLKVEVSVLTLAYRNI